jgi:hypothetical protein
MISLKKGEYISYLSKFNLPSKDDDKKNFINTLTDLAKSFIRLNKETILTIPNINVAKDR